MLRPVAPFLALLAALPAACGTDEPAVPRPSAEAGASFPREVVAAGGARVRVPARPVRIVPATAGALDLLASLVEPERLAAVPATAAIYASLEVDARLADRPTFARYSGEELLPHRPDLVVVGSWQRVEATRVLAGAGVPVLRLGEVRSFADLAADVERLGRATGDDERAREVIGGLERRRDALARRAAETAGLGATRVMTYLNFGTGGWTAGAGTSGDLLLRLAGVRNAAADAGIEGNVQVDHERLLEIDADALVVRATAEAEDYSSTADYLRGEPALAGLSAVRGDRIVVLPPALFSTDSQRLLDAAERLQAALCEGATVPRK